MNFLRSRSVSQADFELLDSRNPQLSMCFDYKLRIFFLFFLFSLFVGFMRFDCVGQTGLEGTVVLPLGLKY